MKYTNWPIRQAQIAVVVLFTFAGIPADAAPKTDIVILTNGDKLTGEVKELRRGRLDLSTDSVGRVSIEWGDVAKIISNQNIQVETDTGTRFFGKLVGADQDSRLAVKTSDGIQVINTRRVIIMEPIEGQGLRNLDVDVSIGYNFAKANGVKQVTAAIDMDWRTLERIYSISASSVISDSSTQDASENSNLTFTYRRLWRDRWYVYGSGGLNRNDELGLDMRSSIGSGVGRYGIQNDSMLLSWQVGLLYSLENFAGEVDDRDSVESNFGLAFDWFRFHDPELDWSTTINILPNLSDIGRVRGDFDTSLKWEMINDLKWNLSFYATYDSDPQSLDAENVDYGVNTMLTYEF